MGYDAIVVGAGHNGLVAGFYLARAGLRTLILERRDIVGGACVTEEFAPGFRASTGAYVLSMLRESVWRDMRLVQRGIRVDAAGPTLNLYPDGAHLLDDGAQGTLDEARRFSPRDVEALTTLDADLQRLSRAVLPFFERTPPDPRIRNAHDVRELHAGRTAGPTPSQRHPGSGVPLHDLDHSVPAGAVRVRARDGRARVACDQRQRGGSIHARNSVRPVARSRGRGVRWRPARVGIRPWRHGACDRGDGRRRARGRR